LNRTGHAIQAFFSGCGPGCELRLDPVRRRAGAGRDALLRYVDRVRDGETLADDEKRNAHDACLRALAATSNVVQKYHLQEADFDIMGTRPKN